MRNLMLVALVAILILGGCKKNRLKIDVSDIHIELELYRVDELMFKEEPGNVIERLVDFEKSHPDFVSLYLEDIIRVGNIDHPDFEENLMLFLTDSIHRQVADHVLEKFEDIEQLRNMVVKGFKHYNYYFPERIIPSVYLYFSGFNESLLIAEDFIGVSLEKYLGADCIFYEYLGIPRFKAANMNPSKIVPDLFYAWAITEFPQNYTDNNLLTNMVHQGKLLYFTEAMIPSMHDSLIIGYTGDQIKWCKINEAAIWAFLVEKRLLYNSDRLELRRYMGDAPFTNTFGNDSPGRTGVWLGWQIVRSFMNNNPEITLAELMEMNNAQELLNRSKYYPD